MSIPPPPLQSLAREPEPEPEDDRSSSVMRLGVIVAGGVLAAVVSSLPAALRMANASSASGALERWLVLAALATPLAVAAVAVLRRARVGVQLLAGARAPLFAMGVLLWCLIELVVLSAFGALLSKTTHHRALAGVTFAIFAVVTGVVVALVARRAATVLARKGAGAQKLGLGVVAGCAFVGVMLVGVRMARAEETLAASALVDALAFTVTTTIASSRLLGRWRPMAIAGVPVAVLVIMVGLTLLRFEPALQQALPETAPMHSLVLALLGA